VAVVLLDRFLGLLALALFAGGALLAAPVAGARAALGGNPAVAGLAVGGLGLLGVLGVRRLFAARSRTPDLLRRLARSPRLPRRLSPLAARAADTLELFRGKGTVVAGAMLLSFGLQAAVVLNYWALARALGAPLPLLELLVVVPVTVVLTSLPISINGVGVRENVWAAVLRSHGFGNAAGVALAWLDYAVVLAQALAGAALFLLPRRGAAGRAAAASAGAAAQPAAAEGAR
jgi:hypothetical protein